MHDEGSAWLVPRFMTFVDVEHSRFVTTVGGLPTHRRQVSTAKAESYYRPLQIKLLIAPENWGVPQNDWG